MTEKPVSRVRVPVFEPEVLEARRRAAVSQVSVPGTTSFEKFLHRGIELYSRDCSAEEFTLIMDGIDGMVDLFRNHLRAVHGRSGDFDFALDFDGFLAVGEMGAALVSFESTIGDRIKHRGMIATVGGEPQIAISGN